MPLVVDTFKAGTIEATQSITVNGQPVGNKPISSIFIDTTPYSNFKPIGESSLENVFLGGETPETIIKLSDGSFLITRLSNPIFA